LLNTVSQLTVDLSAGGNVNVTGNATLGGTLTLVITAPPTGAMLLVLSASSVGGQFSAVSVVPQYANCSEVTAAVSYSPSTVSVTLSSPPCPNPVNVGLIVGLTVGIGGAAIAVAIVGVVLYRRQSHSALSKLQQRVQTDEL
jgi:hypothetical protein